MRPAAALALASLLPLTSGCIAAVVPLAAGAVVVRTQAGREPARSDGPLATASARSDIRIVRTSLTALPPPDAPVLPGNPSIAAFQNYALGEARAGVEAGKRTSTILPDASALRPTRVACGALPLAVFIDLDPGRGTFDPLAPGTPNPALGATLASLRGQGIGVVWFSRLGANFAAATRAALAQSGLDPEGQDELVLMHDIGERKQTLRDAVARRLCPVAMLGDERADFDELYLYLKNPDAAIALDAMIDKGWFLASPFAEQAPGNSGATP